MSDGAEVTRRGVLDMQVCVPADWDDYAVKRFADRENLCGTSEGWLIRREGDKALAGAAERVTPREQPGTHGYDAAPNATRAFHTYSRIDKPPAMDVVDLATHRSLRVVSDASALTARLAPMLAHPTEFFTVGIGEGVTLDGWMM